MSSGLALLKLSTIVMAEDATNTRSTSGLLDPFAARNVYLSMADLKHAVATYFARRNLGFKMPVNNKQKLKVVCTDHKKCTFCLWAFRLDSSDQERISRVQLEHSSEYVDCTTDRQRAPCQARGVLLTPVAKETVSLVGDTTKLSQIRKKAKIDHCIDVTSIQAYREKKGILESSVEHGKEPSQDLNAQLTTFRASIVHGAFNDVFNCSLPVLAVDACHRKTKDQGLLYLASVLTGNFDILVIGMAVSNSSAGKNKDDWVWFLEALKEGILGMGVMPNLVMVSDRDKSLITAVEHVLPGAHHPFCSVHIKRNVVANFHTGLDGKIHDIARAALQPDVDKMLSDLRASRPDIADNLEGIGNQHWITAYFPVPRFGIVTFNVAETMNSVIGEERRSSHLSVFVRLTRRTASRLTQLQEELSSISDTSLVPCVRNIVKLRQDRALQREVLVYKESGRPNVFEVKRLGVEEFRIVDLDKKTCSCGICEEMQFPCSHAQAALHRQRLDFSTHPVFLAKTCKECVGVCIRPVDVSLCVSDGINHLVFLGRKDAPKPKGLPTEVKRRKRT